MSCSEVRPDPACAGLPPALAAVLAAGIPLTAPELASRCVLLDAGALDTADWSALAEPGQTRVFADGGPQAARIAAELQRHGLAAYTPAARIDGEAVVATGLAALAAGTGTLVVGETVRLSRHYEAAPAATQPAAPAANTTALPTPAVCSACWPAGATCATSAAANASRPRRCSACCRRRITRLRSA